MSEIEFLDELPDKASGRPAKYREFFDTLRAHPGKWAEWPGTTTSQNILASIQRGSYGGAAPGEFTAAMRTVDGVRRFYSYVGNGQAS